MKKASEIKAAAIRRETTSRRRHAYLSRPEKKREIVKDR